MHTFRFIVGNIIPKSVKCIHSATMTKFRIYKLRVLARGMWVQGLWVAASGTRDVRLDPREDLEGRSPNLGPYTTKGTL